jgi:hypothetical protein
LEDVLLLASFQFAHDVAHAVEEVTLRERANLQLSLANLVSDVVIPFPASLNLLCLGLDIDQVIEDFLLLIEAIHQISELIVFLVNRIKSQV